MVGGVELGGAHRAVAELAYGLPQALTQLADALQLSLTALDIYNRDGERGDSAGAAVHVHDSGRGRIAAAARHLSSARISSSPNVRPSAIADSDSAIDAMIRGSERQSWFRHCGHEVVEVVVDLYHFCRWQRRSHHQLRWG